MLNLLLAVVSSAMVSIVMRLSTGKVNHNIGMLAVNYIVCTLLAGIPFGFRGLVDPSDSRLMMTTAMGAVNGVLYLGGFMLMQINTQRNGIVLSSIFQKLGLLVTLVISVFFYHELPDMTQSMGFVLAVSAIVLMNYQKGGGTAGFRAGLILMLLTCGMADAMSKIFAESGVTDLEQQFLFFTFGTAMLCSLACMLAKGQRIGSREVLYGTMIAVPNFFASKFLLGALESLPGVIVYPVFSVGCILAVTLTGVAAFRERLTGRQWIGIGIILVALVLLNI